MTSDELLGIITQGLFVLIALVVGLRALRRRTRTNVDTALLFGSVGSFVLLSEIERILGIEDIWFLAAFSLCLILALPYFLFRLVDDFSEVSGWLIFVVNVAAGVLLAITFILHAPWARQSAAEVVLPIWYLLLMALWFLLLGTYATVAFLREGSHSSGVTRRRMQAAAAGSLLLATVIVVAVLGGIIEPLQPVSALATPLGALLAVLAYLVAFTPPSILRRAWQEPELRAFLSRAAALPRLPTTADIIFELQAGAAASTGATSAAIGLWDEEARVLRWLQPDGVQAESPAGAGLAGRAFSQNQAILSVDAASDDPQSAADYRAMGAKAILAAPINAGDKRLGVLAVWAAQPPVFSDDDLALVRLLADQAAVILESRSLIDEATHVRAAEESNRLKDDFLSIAAHDLKTPLTNILGQAQLMEIRAQRDPTMPASAEKLRKIIEEGQRMRDLIVRLLDTSRERQRSGISEREKINIGEMVAEAAERHNTALHPTQADVESVWVLADPLRLRQLLTNLLDNAAKYSPNGGAINLRVWREGDEAHLTVTDSGIGIPPDDLPHVFDRFQRAGNADDRQFSGMGLGLYICREVVREHGGRIWVSSQPGSGTTFHVALPLAEEEVKES